ncbi:MAG: hypothetical protein F4X64_14100 [Chloroflexi bacterium]|nr:hypothetical protein [Chloroflexota bacterium]
MARERRGAEARRGGRRETAVRVLRRAVPADGQKDKALSFVLAKGHPAMKNPSDEDLAVVEAAHAINQLVFAGAATPQQAIAWGVIQMARILVAEAAAEATAVALAEVEHEGGATLN